jgi:hypothetical protein
VVPTSSVDLPELPNSFPDLNSIEHVQKDLEKQIGGTKAIIADQKSLQLEAARKKNPISVVHTLLHLCHVVVEPWWMRKALSLSIKQFLTVLHALFH